LNDTSLESVLPYLEEKGMGVINASILSMGLLTEQVSQFQRSDRGISLTAVVEGLSPALLNSSSLPS